MTAPASHPHNWVDGTTAITAARLNEDEGDISALVSAHNTLVGTVAGKQTTLSQTATAKTGAYTANANEVVRADTSSGTFAITGPTAGAPFGVRWTAGTTGPTITAPAGYTITGAASVVMSTPPAGSSGELIVWAAFGTDYQPVGGFKPQAALDAHHLTLGKAPSSGTNGQLVGMSGGVIAMVDTTNVTAASLGLGSVDNTHDVDKPISALTQAALDAKRPLISAGTHALVTGRYYPAVPTISTSTGTITQSRLRLMPMLLDESNRFDRIASRVSTAAASSTLRWTVYSDVGGLPGALLLDTGAVGDATTTGTKEATIDITLPAGRVWLGVVAQGGNPTMITANSGNAPGMGFASLSEIDAQGNAVAIYQDSVTGAAPATFTGTAATGAAAAIFLRKA